MVGAPQLGSTLPHPLCSGRVADGVSAGAVVKVVDGVAFVARTRARAKMSSEALSFITCDL